MGPFHENYDCRGDIKQASSVFWHFCKLNTPMHAFKGSEVTMELGNT